MSLPGGHLVAGPPVQPPTGMRTLLTLPAVLIERARTTPNAVALRKKHLGRWKPYTWSDYVSRVAKVAAGLQALGVRAGDRVAIQAENRPAWVISDLAVQSLGAVTVGVYPTSPHSELQYLLNHSGAVVLIAEDEEQYDKAIAVWDRVPALRNVVVADTRGVDLERRSGLMSFAQLEVLGQDGTPEWLASGVAELDPSKTAIIVYTSGTTGPPKGAMLSQANLMGSARSSDPIFALSEDDEALSYLPLCHIAERLVSVVSALTTGYIVNFGEGGEAFMTDMQEVQPTLFLGVPRVWEKLMASVEIRMKDASPVKKVAYNLARNWGATIAQKRMAGTYGPVEKAQYLVCWLIAFRSLRKKLGLLRVASALSGAAPISPQVLEWFWAMGIPVREAYGQTENTALCTVMPADGIRMGSVGKPYPGVEVRRAADGELLTRGPGVFVGYFGDPDATARTFDTDGWLITGDIGEIDASGYITITDRKKDLIITSGGKNISPSEIEGMLKVSPFIREAVVIGDGRKYLVALIGIELDTVGGWAAHHNIAYTTYEDLSGKPEVVELIANEVGRANVHLANVETIKKFALLPKELEQEDGEVTATQKVKRAAIATQYSELIESLYPRSEVPSA